MIGRSKSWTPSLDVRSWPANVSASAPERDAQQLLELRDRLGGARVVHGRHAHRTGRLEVAREGVDEDAVLGRKPDPLGAERVDLRVGLAHALLAGDDPAVEELGEAIELVAVGAPRVRDQAGPDALALGHD